MSAQSLIVNALTFLRVPLIFAWLICAVMEIYDGRFWLGCVALVAMFLSGLTDAVDGALARRWNVVSQLGKMADPLMDKIFYVVTFPALTWMIARRGGEDFHALLMLSFTILYILRDLWITFMRSVGTMFGADVAAMWLGKVRTALSFPVAGFIYLYLWLVELVSASWAEIWLWSCYSVEIFMIVLNLVSTITYTRAYLPYLKKALERR